MAGKLWVRDVMVLILGFCACSSYGLVLGGWRNADQSAAIVRARSIEIVSRSGKVVARLGCREIEAEAPPGLHGGGQLELFNLDGSPGVELSVGMDGSGKLLLMSANSDSRVLVCSHEGGGHVMIGADPQNPSVVFGVSEFGQQLSFNDVSSGPKNPFLVLGVKGSDERKGDSKTIVRLRRGDGTVVDLADTK